MGLFHLELIHYYVTPTHIQSCSNTPEKQLTLLIS